MGSGNYETQILEAIQILVDNAVAKADYDKTIQGTVSRCVDKTIGKYLVRYQDSSFYAFSSNTDVTYPAGTLVYVLVPGNDMSNDKTIVGTVDRLGPDYVSIIEGENGYEVTGVNTINSDAIFELCSYKAEEIKMLYDRDSGTDLINLDTFGLESYIKKSNSIICGAAFRTALPAEQKFRGDYGIGFNLDFIDNATGETVTRSYLVNVDQMTGNPYNYTKNNRQYGIFEVDGANFISVQQIYIFEYNFPNTETDKSNDIFISKIELSAANALNADEAATCALTFVTPQGTYFDENNFDSDIRTIEAQIRIKGNNIDNDSQLVDYYWFRENNDITTKSEKYNQYGGAGWECLNDYSFVQNATDTEDAIVQWSKGKYNYITTKAQNVAKETAYKCVAVYANDTVLTRTIVIYNYDSEYEISIKSDSGVAFTYDNGNPTLTCYINGVEELGDEYYYSWSEVNSSNQFAVLTETADDNNTYNDAITGRDAILAKVAAEGIISGSEQEQLELYNQIIAQYEYVMRVEHNKIHKLKISSITKFSTYKCSVYKSGVFIGTASIIITNTLENDDMYSLVIENGNQVFKYNEAGISPANGSVDNPITILPLSFTLYDEKGQKINWNAIGRENIAWTLFKSTDSLITVSPSHGNPSEETENTVTYLGPELNFTIANTYNARKDKNEIQLLVKYKDKIISAKTNFTFVKEGENGTNGTNFVCKIIPNNQTNTIAPKYPVIYYNNYNKTYSLNFERQDTYKWFKVQLWKDGEVIFENTETGNSSEGKQVKVNWSILKNTYSRTVADESNLTIDAQGNIDFDATKLDNPANIVKCSLEYNGVEYFATMPVVLVRTANPNLVEVQYMIDSGFRQVMYTADGQSPAYDDQPFEIKVYQIAEGAKNDVSHFESSQYAVDYNWSVKGQVYYTDWQSEQNLVKNTLWESKELRNQKYFKPVDTYNGLCVNNAIECSITREDFELAHVHIPVHLLINRYGNAAMNGWDGNSISLDEEGGIILAPQVGAGSKNDDNTFTGVFMGSVKEAGAEKEEHGLFGYNAGQRTITLNSEDGSARFGKAGAGQIVIDPSTGAALLTSGNYDEEEGTGMEINLSEPSIKFGSGNFGVTADGQMYATGFTTTKQFEDEQTKRDEQITDLENSVKVLDVKANIPTTLIPATSDRVPREAKTYQVTISAKYKGKDVNNLITIEEAFETSPFNISINKNIISVGVTQTALEDDVTNLTFNVKYLEESEPITLSFGLAIQGEDGTIGEDGKSAYQIWLEAGNTGTEQDYLNSLKGEDGAQGESSYTHIRYSEDGGQTFWYPQSTLPIGYTQLEYIENASGNLINTGILGNAGVTVESRLSAPKNGDYGILSVRSTDRMYFLYIYNGWTLGYGSYYQSNILTIGQMTTVKSILKVGEQKLIVNGLTAISLTDQTRRDTNLELKLFNGNTPGVKVEYLKIWEFDEESQTDILKRDYIACQKDDDGTIGLFDLVSNEFVTNSGSGTLIGGPVATQDNTSAPYMGVLVSTNPTPSENTKDYTWSLIKGTGEQGVGIKSVIEQYCLSDSNTEAPEEGWSYTQEPWTVGKYIWTRSEITYTNDEIEYTDAILAQAINSANENANQANNTADSATSTANQAKEDAAAALNKSNENTANLTLLSSAVDDLQSQVDGSIATWFYDYVPTNDNIPAVNWNTEELKTQHLGDLFYIVDNNEKAGQCYRYAYLETEGYKWIIVEDVDVAKALADAAKAQETADGKITVYITQPTVPYQVGDLWNNNGKQYTCTTTRTEGSFNSADWEELLTYTDDTVANEAKDIADEAKKEADQAIETADTANTKAEEAKIDVQNTINRVDLEYIQTDSAINIPAESDERWATTAPEWIEGMFIWSRQRYYYVDESKPSTLSEPTCITGNTGADGASGRGVAGIVSFYLASNLTSGITSKTQGWTTEIQIADSSKPYLWYYEVINYTDDTSTETTPIILGNYSEDGRGVTAIITYYALSTNTTVPSDDKFSTDVKTMTATDKYLWSFEKTTYTTGDPTLTDKRIIGVYGDKGENGEKGADGAGIQQTIIKYATNSNGTNPPTSGWQDTIPTANPGQYVWTQTTIKYTTDIADSVSYSVALQGKTGADGKDGAQGPGAQFVKINPSAQFFKSTQGQDGEFLPEYIYLYPTFQNDTYGKWQYSLNGGSSWVDVVNAAGLTIGTYDNIANSLRIQNTCTLYTNEITTITFKCISADMLTPVSDSVTIAKIYDVTEILAVKETQILYTRTDRLDVDLESLVWSEDLNETSGKYIWQRIKKIYVDNTESTSIPVCVSNSEAFIVDVEIQYAKSNDANNYPDEENENLWTTSKPDWSPNVYIWSRTKTTWSNGDTDYSNYVCDKDAQTLQNNINERANSILSSLEDEGCVRILQDTIYIMNNRDELKATELLCLNEQGIGFATKQAGDPISSDMFTSVWSLDGTFDAQSIIVTNLSATNIKNGILRLYDTTANPDDGKVLIFKGDPPAGEADAADDDLAIVTISSTGIDIKLNNGSKFKVDTTEGFRLVNPIGENVVYSSEDGQSLNITKTKIIKEISFGDSLKGVMMEKTVNNKLHRGIGFIRI